MAKFDLKGLLNDRSVPDRQQDQKIVYRNPKDLIPSEENFYNTEKLERLKQSIKLLGILQPLLIENRDGKDYVIAGHCRRKCCIDLLNEGNDRFSRVPCIYKTHSELEQDAGQEDDIVRQIMIIQANCYRDKSDWEKMTETLKMEGLVKELREKTPMEGKTRDILKDLIGTSGGQLGRYHAISTNLCEQLMSEFEEDRIKISVAYEASKLNREYQKQACELYEETGILTLDDIKALYRQQEAEKGIPGQMSIETATGQNRPPEDATEIPAETQIERFYEGTNKNMKNYIIQEDKNMTIFMLSNLYGSARVRNGHLNYQGSTAGITFNPGGVFEHELSWQSLAKNLIGKYGHKRPVKMATINAPEPAITLTESEAVKAFCEAYPEKLKTIMRICRRCKDNGEAAKAVQLEFAPCGFSAVGGYKVNYRFKSFSAGLEIEVNNEKVSMKYGRLIVEAKNLYDPLSPEFDVELKKPETKEDEGPVKCITGQSGSGLCGAAAYCDKKYTCCSQCPDDCNIRCGWIPEKSCQPAVETLDEKQQEDHSGDPAEMVKHLRNTDKIPDAWPEDLKDIPIPSITAINDILDDAEQDLKGYLAIADEKLPAKTILKHQLIAGGLRIIKNLVEDCQEEPEQPEQPPLPEMRNNDQRKQWLREYKSWGLWYTDHHTGTRYYKYDFNNGARLIAEEYDPEPRKESWWTPTESYSLHLVGGPEPERSGGVPKWTYHSKYHKFPNSETELVEFLKEVQKNGKA